MTSKGFDAAPYMSVNVRPTFGSLNIGEWRETTFPIRGISLDKLNVRNADSERGFGLLKL